MPVIYLNESERDAYEIFVGEDGLLYQADGTILDTTDAYTVNATGVKEPSHAIYVMDSRGRIFLSKYHEVGRFHHSSLVAGGPTAIAGEARIAAGCKGLFNNRSGHYKHAPEHLKYLRMELEARGANLEQIQFLTLLTIS